MIQHKCNSCGRIYTAEVYFCSSCQGTEFSDLETREATVVMSLQLFATAAPYPDVYYVNLVENNGTKIFCRSEKQLEKGKTIKIEDDGTGLVCS